MHLSTYVTFALLSLCYTPMILSAPINDSTDLHKYSTISTQLTTGTTRFPHAPDDPILNQLDDALTKISTIYIQALFSGTHSPRLDARMRSMEIELFDLLDLLYKQNRMTDYMKYEAEVTRQMILYNMLKKLFGYAAEENEQVS